MQNLKREIPPASQPSDRTKITRERFVVFLIANMNMSIGDLTEIQRAATKK